MTTEMTKVVSAKFARHIKYEAPNKCDLHGIKTNFMSLAKSCRINGEENMNVLHNVPFALVGAHGDTCIIPEDLDAVFSA